MNPIPKKLRARFYQTENAKEPVRQWLLSLDVAAKKAIGVDIQKVEYGWPLGMPTCKALGRGLFEVRTTLPSNRIARVLFCTAGEEMILLHGFIKKTQTTPHSDLQLAQQRQKDCSK